MNKCPSAYFTEDEQQLLVEELMDLLVGHSSSNLDVVMKVLLPETLIKVFMDIKTSHTGQAEEQLPEEEVLSRKYLCEKHQM